MAGGSLNTLIYRGTDYTAPMHLFACVMMSGVGVSVGRKRCTRLSAMWATRGEENGWASTARRGPSRSAHAWGWKFKKGFTVILSHNQHTHTHTHVPE